VFNRATEVLGADGAEILMVHLPPGGWPNLATKQDVLAQKQDMQALERSLKRDLSELEHRMRSFTLRAILGANLGMAVAFGGIAFAAAGIGS
jgi:hypothetical protein